MLASYSDTRIIHVIILTESMSQPQRLRLKESCCHCAWLYALQWIYIPGNAGIRVNERVDRLASTLDITADQQHGRAEVFRGLRNFFKLDRPEHYSIDCLKEKGMGLKRGRCSPSRVGYDLCSIKHWYCFERHLWQAAEKWGGVRMTLSERARGNWKLADGEPSNLQEMISPRDAHEYQRSRFTSPHCRFISSPSCDRLVGLVVRRPP